MQIKKLLQNKNELYFELQGADYIFANTIRRVILVEVPTLAIEEVNFIKNDSALYDEIVAHRLGLIPLTTDLKSYDLKEECTCKGKGCAKCELHLSLKAKGPCMVYSSEIKSTDPKVKPVYDNIPIVQLLKGQKLEFEATAILGKGKQHAKFSPCWVYYQGKPEFKILKDSNLNKMSQCDGLKISNDKIEITDISKWKESYEEACEKSNIEVKRSRSDFIFYIESFGQLTTTQIFEESINVLNKKLDEFAKKIKSTKESNVQKIKKKIKKEK